MAATAAESLKAGKLDEALADLNAQIRAAPADAALRVFLFQLLCVLGRWEKALTQLQVLAEMNAETALLAQVFKTVIGCEILRAEVFRGKKSPLIFGTPQEWVGWLVQANTMIAAGQFKVARELRERALDAAPAVGGSINGKAFGWIGDADSRLGPLMEAMIDGKYFWVPFECISKVVIEPPTDLRDLVWIPARFTWTNGGEASGFIPVRYPASEDAADGGIRLARKTDWLEREEGTFLGLGQRMFATDEGDFSLLEVRLIELALNAGQSCD